MTPDREDTPAGHLFIIDSMLSHHRLRRLGAVAVPDSILNRNYRVETPSGPLFARIYGTRRDRARIEREHRAAAWAAARGLPAVAPLRDAEGTTVHRVRGAFAALFPWITGRSLPRERLEEPDLEALGALLADLQLQLEEFDDPSLERGKVGSAWDTATAIETLSRVDDLIRYYPAVPDDRLRIQKALRRQLALLEGDSPRPPGDFDDLPRQPCHGDFHERNVIFGPEGNVIALVDWEFVSLLPPVYELVRALTLLGLLDRPRGLDAFLRAYRSRRPITAAEFRRGVEMRWQAILHDTWIYREVFIRGNRAAGRFFESHWRWIEQLSRPAFRADLSRRLASAE